MDFIKWKLLHFYHERHNINTFLVPTCMILMILYFPAGLKWGCGFLAPMTIVLDGKLYLFQPNFNNYDR